jgi:hypothetical protein
MAIDNRKILTSLNMEFDFNNLTNKIVEYDSLIHRIVKKNEQYAIRAENDIRVVIYDDGKFQTLYKTPEIIRGTDTGENIGTIIVETEQGAITINGVDMPKWAPDEGVYFAGTCERYTWELPEHLKDYLGAGSYVRGVFKMLPDNSIQFVAPLPDGIGFAGEDINGMSYFYDNGIDR